MSVWMRSLVIAVMLVVGLSVGARAEDDPHQILEDDIVLGDMDAPITLIEYASLSCPHCAHFHNNLLPEIKKDYVDTGKVKFVFRSFPLDLPALKGTVLAYCAGESRFYAFLRVLFDTQESWAFQKNFLEMLANIGKLGGVKGEEFDACMDDKTLEEKILQTKLVGAKEMDVKSTPTFYINGEKFEKGRTAADFAKAFDAILNPVEVEESAEAEPVSEINDTESEPKE